MNQSYPSLVEFDHATVMRGETKALDQISFKIGVGENVAIIGPNGSGKSTLIKSIVRECYPQIREEGPAVKIMGEHTWNIFSLRAMLGIVAPEIEKAYDRDISGLDMVLSGFFGSVGIFPYHKITDAMKERAWEVMRFLEVDHLSAKYIAAMSTGQARKMLIGRALVHDPDALILDEPTNGLDPRATRRFIEAIRKIAQGGKSIIMVTHHLWDIVPEIERIIMIKEGRVFLDGPKAEVLTEANLSALFNTDVKLFTTNGLYHLVI